MSRRSSAAAAAGDRSRPLLAGAVLALTSTALAVLAWPVMYWQIAAYDDEGYMLVSLRAYAAGGRLYDEVYSQYGPAYYGVMDALFRLLGLTFVHDTGRLITLAVLVVTSLLCALLTLRITGHLAIAVAVQLLAAVNLFALGNEPMHPGGLLCLLLMLAACAPLLASSRPRSALVLMSGLPTVAALIKVNIGGLALLSVGFAWAATLRGAWARPLRTAASLAMVAAPFALVGANLGQPNFLRLACHTASGALALAIIAPVAAPVAGRLGDLRWLALGALLGLALGCGPALIGGTSVAGLVDGILLRPLGQPGVFTYPYGVPRWAPFLWVLVVAGSLAWRRSMLRRAALPGGAAALEPLVAVLRIGVGVALAVAATGAPFGRPTLNLAPLAWLAAAAPRAGDDGGAAWARWLLPALAMMQVMHAYPVAGSQQSFAALLLVPCGGVCVADGLGQLGRWLRSTSWAPTQRAARLALLLLAIGLVGAAGLRFERAQERYRSAFATGVPLDLPGARWVRVAPSQKESYHGITAQIRKHCDRFVTVPGMNSLYLFAEQEPPTGLNTTAWMFLLTDAEKQHIVDRLAAADAPCAVRHPWVLQFWARGRPIPRDPLLDYIARDLRLRSDDTGFKLLARPPAAGAAQR